VTSIGVNAFAQCYSLSDVTIRGNSLVSIDSFAFHSCYSLETITLPEGLTNIGYDAFAVCNKLRDINLPCSLVNVRSGAFFMCPMIDNVYYNGTKEMWQEINIESNNSFLLNATLHFNSKQITYTAPLPEGNDSANVVLALYDERGAYVGTQIIPVTADDTGVSFVVDTTTAHSYKIILFDALDTIKPLCEDVKDNI
jgi:hypothetical protein